MIDKYGARFIALFSIPMLALTMYALGHLGNSLAAFFVLFFAAGCFGGGTTPVVYTRVVNANFDRSRGLALGIVLAGTGIPALVLPPTIAATIGWSGWRAGFILLAIASALAWPLVFFGFRGRGGSGSAARAERRRELLARLL